MKLSRNEIIVDSFAGGGGASEGIETALGRPVDVAINHDAAAIAMHAANHPNTLHLTEDVWKIAPQAVLRLRRRRGRWQLPPEGWQEWPSSKRVGLLWASPDCKHFSRAKGSQPVNKNIRSLAWVVCKWAAQVKPRVIMLENVREFADWGPVVPAWRCQACQWRGTEGQTTLARTRRRCPRCESLRLKVTDERIPNPARKGETFRRFVNRLKALGYAVEWKNLNAADYGAPTHRRRLFLIARCDGAPIVWPEPTHGDPKKLNELPLFERLKPWRTAAECIDWSLPCPSIFERKKPLAEATMRRIAHGIKRYVLEAAEPFIVRCNHGGEHFRGQPTSGPMCTLTSSRDAHGLVVPVVTRFRADDKGSQIDAPLPTVTANSFNKRPGGCAPLGLVEATVSPFIVGAGGAAYAGKPRSTEQPLNTIKGDNRQVLIAPVVATLAHGGSGTFGDSRAHDVNRPIGTVHAGVGNHALVAAFLAKHFGGVVGQVADQPASTVTAKDHHSLVAANLIRMNHGEKQWSSCDEPLSTVTGGGNHAALVYSFLVRYFGTAIGQHVTEPLFTVTGKDRFGLVTVTIGGELYVIVDIGMRMLTPRELARAQGFSETYVLTGTKSNQVARIGNSVCPVMANALVRANLVDAPKATARSR